MTMIGATGLRTGQYLRGKPREKGSYHLERKPWCRVIKEFGFSWVPPPDLPNLLHGWKTKALNTRGRKKWRLVPAAICWSISLERNNRVFEGFTEPSFQVYNQDKDKTVWWGLQCKSCSQDQPRDLRRDWNGVIGHNPIWLGVFCSLPLFLFSPFWGYLIPFSLFNKVFYSFKKKPWCMSSTAMSDVPVTKPLPLGQEKGHDKGWFSLKLWRW